MMNAVRDSLEKVARIVKKYADKGRRPLEFQMGNQVLLKLTPQMWNNLRRKNIHKGLVPRYNGSFEVIKRISNVAYQLKLPDWLKIHLSFHVSFLKLFSQDLLDLNWEHAKRAPTVI